MLIPLVALLALPTYTVCLDPGHPSETASGTAMQNGIREVALCWQVASLVRTDLQARGVRVVMTKTAEMQFVTNKHRAEIANAAKADLMVRIHADSGGGHGYTVFYPRRTGTIDKVMGPSQSVILASETAARKFLPAFKAAIGSDLRSNGLRGDDLTLIGSKHGALTGSIYSKVPVLLLEMGFLDSASDAAWLGSAKNQARMAKAIAAGIIAAKPAPRRR
jgi:N-acetylmuramoyl-L-alanine amidase